MRHLVAVVGMLTACSPHGALPKRPEDPQVDAAITAMWTHDIAEVAHDGDWILTQSYLVADGDLSHASIYDAKAGTIIEAVDAGIHELPLAQLVERNAYVIVVHPTGMTDAQRSESVARARTKLGHPFDTGVDHQDTFYCSELVYWAAQTEARAGRRDKLLTPSDLMTYGEVVYWSGKREDQ
ncbi:MAG: YiiX/YebB-like N1pC/P60 family cysteine hydrolase [Kofleriaceae bacterium]